MKSIILNTEMVQAIFNGTKTQIRRVIKYGLYIDYTDTMNEHSVEIAKNYCDLDDSSEDIKETFIKYHGKYKVDDILYVKETFAENFGIKKRIVYKSEFNNDYPISLKWKPSVHLKEKDARIFIKVTNVSAERLQDITYDDCLKEGFLSMQLNPDCSFPTVLKDTKIINTITEMEDWFKKQWNSTAKDGYKYEDNPPVFVYEFEIVENKECRN